MFMYPPKSQTVAVDDIQINVIPLDLVLRLLIAHRLSTDPIARCVTTSALREVGIFSKSHMPIYLFIRAARYFCENVAAHFEG